MARRNRVGALLVAFGLSSAATARADIDPPFGYAWVPGQVTITNLEAFPNYVFVAWPCQQTNLIDEYCVFAPDEPSDVRGTLYALSTRDAAAGPKPGWDPAFKPVPRVLLHPEPNDLAAFFQKDPRVIRPGFRTDRSFTSLLPSGTGVKRAEYFLEIERVGPSGVEARFVRAKYTCAKGDDVELAWGPRQDLAPTPICPVTDDQGELIHFADGGKVSPGATSTLPGPWPEATTGPVAREQLIWGGVLSTSLSLLGAGLMLRRNKRPTNDE